MVKQFHSVRHDMRIRLHRTSDPRLEGEIRILNHVHVLSFSLFSKPDTVTRYFANMGQDSVEICVFEEIFFCDAHKLSAVKGFGLCCAPIAHPAPSHERSVVSGSTFGLGN